MLRYPGVKTVPYITIDNTAVGGYDKLVERLSLNENQFLAG